jgi:electron transfer flavoprotein alpha subunit
MNNREILVCCEVANDELTSVFKELLTIGNNIKTNLPQPLSSLLIGKNIENACQETINFGSDKVYFIEAPDFTDVSPDVYVSLITTACQQIEPSIVIFPQDEMGREVAPRLASRLNANVTLDCIGLTVDGVNKRLLQTKPVYGGNATAIWVGDLNQIQIVTIRPRSVIAAQPDTSRHGEIVQMNVIADDSASKCHLIQTIREETKGIKLEDAKIIVTGGGGIGNAEGFKLLDELAKVLGGTVAVTRVPCDQGWMPLSLEIGQTGRIVGPNLYIAIGVSGAPQHMAGCSGSKIIVSINRDPDARIFKESNFGLVGDYKKVLPALTKRCQELLS